MYPQTVGTHPAWNTLPGSNDTQFIRDLIDNLARRCNIHPARIYASGASNGGGMVNQLACDLADRIVAIGSVSGAYQRYEDFSPLRPVAIFAIHGTDDSAVPYNGLPEWAAGWAQRNKCDRESTEVLHNMLISERKWSNCHAGADVVLYTIQGGGHEWPSDLIHVDQAIWDFFVPHPRVETP